MFYFEVITCRTDDRKSSSFLSMRSEICLILIELEIVLLHLEEVRVVHNLIVIQGDLCELLFTLLYDFFALQHLSYL